MSDNQNNAAAPEAATQFEIVKIYTKDVSFETPNSPEIFKLQWTPKTAMQLNSETRKLDDNVFEVVLSVTVTTKLDEKTAYLVEVHQAGIFALQGFNDRDRDAMLGSYCPNILYAFARSVVADQVGKGGFPAIYIKPVNFDAMYLKQVETRGTASVSETMQ